MTLQEINQNIAANLNRICQEKGMDKAEFIKDLITHFSDINYPNVSKETIYQMVNGGRKRNESKDLSPVSFGIEKLHAVSEYLGISIDGFISNDKPLTNDPEIQTICEYTGLNEEAVKELNKWKKFFKPDSICSTTILKFLFPFLEKILNYQLFFIKEIEGIIFLKENIKENIVILSGINDESWFCDSKNQPDIINEDFKDIVFHRKAALFDIQEFTLNYATKCTEELTNNPNICTETIKMEKDFTPLYVYYDSLFHKKRNEIIRKAGNYGEHN